MNSFIKLNSSLLLPYYSKLKLQHQQHQNHLLLRHTNLPCNLSMSVQQSLHFAFPGPVMAKSLPHSFVIAASSPPPKPLDISDFLQTSALLLFLYFTANFIVPELISKYNGFDKVNKDQNGNDINTKEDR